MNPDLHTDRLFRVTRRSCLRTVLGSAVAHEALRTAGFRTAAASDRPTRTPPQTIRSCIVLFQYGGPSQLETFDPKPDAPLEVRGEYASIETVVPGIRVSEHLPRTAKVMDRIALVRSVHHPMRNHNSAAAEVLTGRTPAGGDLELLADEARSFPTLGSAVSYGLADRAFLLPYVALPYTMYNVVQLPGQTPGLLGGAHERFQVQGNPNNPDFHVSALDLPGSKGASTLAARAALLSKLDERIAGDGSPARMRLFQKRALDLLGSDSVRHSFDIDQEQPEMRDRYGRHLFGQSALLARRLVETGVNFVSVFNGERNGQEENWDSHTNLFPRHRQLIPPLDQTFSALLEDLELRGLLDSTLVICMGEFGRTPRVNGSAGRDHWPDCFTVALAGGGIRGGTVYGASDQIAAYPDRDPVTPSDIAATILDRFGIPPALEVHDQTNRPYQLAEGRPLLKLFA